MENIETPLKKYILAQPFAGDVFIEKAILSFKQEYNIVNAIETGTHIGATFHWLYNNFDHVYTCEIDQEYYQIACALIFGHQNGEDGFPSEIIDPPNMGKMTIRNIDSINFIKEVCTNIVGETLFFLDAHWYSYCPLLDELEAIAEAGLKPAVIAIHDFKTNYPDLLGFDSYDDQPYDLAWIRPYINKIYGLDWTFEYNTPKTAAGALRGIIYIKRISNSY